MLNIIRDIKEYTSHKIKKNSCSDLGNVMQNKTDKISK